MNNREMSPLRLWLNILFASLLSLLFSSGYYLVTQLGHFGAWQLFGFGCSFVYIVVMIWGAVAFKSDKISYEKLRFLVAGGFAITMFAHFASCFVLG